MCLVSGAVKFKCTLRGAVQCAVSGAVQYMCTVSGAVQSNVH